MNSTTTCRSHCSGQNMHHLKNVKYMCSFTSCFVCKLLRWWICWVTAGTCLKNWIGLILQQGSWRLHMFLLKPGSSRKFRFRHSSISGITNSTHMWFYCSHLKEQQQILKCETYHDKKKALFCMWMWKPQITDHTVFVAKGNPFVIVFIDQTCWWEMKW